MCKPGIVTAALSICLILCSCAPTDLEYVDISGLESSGNDWEIVYRDSTADSGRLTLHQDKWAMFFLHWRPLTDEGRNLSVAYARHLMLNFWGPDMPFDVSEGGGTFEVGGREAFYVDGTLGDNLIRTRFIVWNCPETNRQVIADCNINLASGSPDSILTMQYAMAATVSCNGTAHPTEHPALGSRYSNDRYKIGFSLPDNWRTGDYENPEWFPNGLSEASGTLWTLLTDSERHVELLWADAVGQVSEETLRELVGRVGHSYPTPAGGEVSIGQPVIETVRRDDDLVVGDGHFLLTQRQEGQESTEPYRFRAFLWEAHDRTYVLLAGAVKRTEVWGREFDLSPSDETFDRYIMEELLPNIPVFGAGT